MDNNNPTMPEVPGELQELKSKRFKKLSKPFKEEESLKRELKNFLAVCKRLSKVKKKMFEKREELLILTNACEDFLNYEDNPHLKKRIKEMRTLIGKTCFR